MTAVFESAIELSYAWLPVIGFVVGLLATMVGGNGAFFFPPTLILLFQVSPRVAVATSLAAVIPIGLVGSFEHFRRKNINLPVAIVFGSAGFAGALLGAWISGIIDPATLVKTFGIYSIILGLVTLHIPKSKPAGTIPPPAVFADIGQRQLVLVLFFGLIAGLVAGLFGTSGTAPVLAALFILHFPVKLVIGTSVLIVFINALSGFGGHLFMGEIDLQLILLLGSGAAAGAFVGPRLLAYVKPERKEGPVRYIFAAIIILMGVALVIW